MGKTVVWLQEIVNIDVLSDIDLHLIEEEKVLIYV